MADFTPSEPTGRSDKPNSPLLDEEPKEDAGAAAASCTYEGQSYSVGSVICINKDQYKCGSGGGWFKTGFKC